MRTAVTHENTTSLGFNLMSEIDRAECYNPILTGEPKAVVPKEVVPKAVVPRHKEVAGYYESKDGRSC